MIGREAIAHFKKLQKRNTTQHNGIQCALVKTAPYNPDRKEDANSDDVSQWPEWKQRAALSNYDFKKEDSK